MSDFVNTVDSIGDEALTSSIIDRSITEILDNYATRISDYAFYTCTALTTVNFSAVTSIGNYAFRDCSALTTVNFPAATSVGNNAFYSCSKLTAADFPAVTSIGDAAFYNCSKLTTANFPEATNIGGNAFQSCPKLMTADFPAVTSIGSNAFSSCSALMVLILRSGTMATLGNTEAFSGTPIKTGTGYIYVPAALVDSYKAANNWSTYANQIRAIEDYPEICGGETA